MDDLLIFFIGVSVGLGIAIVAILISVLFFISKHWEEF